MTLHVTAATATMVAVFLFMGCESKEQAALRAAATRPVPDPPRLQVRLVVHSPAADATVDSFPDPYPPSGTETMMHVDREVLMHEGHVEYVRPVTDDAGKPVMLLHFTDEGTTLLQQITQLHADERIAFILDGKVLMAPMIRGAIGADAIIDGGEKGFSETERKGLMAALNSAIRRLPAATTPAATQPAP